MAELQPNIGGVGYMSDINVVLMRLMNIPAMVAEALEKGMHTAGEKVQGDATRLVPVDTGQLRVSITERLEIDGKDIVEIVGTNAKHAMYNEFGTGPVGAASPKHLPPGFEPTYRSDGWVYTLDDGATFIRTKGQPAKPFLYPAFVQNKQNIENIIHNAIKDGLSNI